MNPTPIRASINVQVLRTEQAAAEVLEQYAAYADRARLPVAVRLETHLVLDEIVANITRHGITPGQPCMISIDLALDGDFLQVHVIDEGVPFDPLSLPPGGESAPGDLPTGHFGIILTKRFAEDLTYRFENGKNHLSFRKRVPYTRLRDLMNASAGRSRNAT